MAVAEAPVLSAGDFASPAACEALAARLIPLGIRLDAYELGLLHARLGRVPRWAELVIMNTMWSEHCSYKSTRHLLKRLPTEAPQVVLGPGEDAGAVWLGTHEGREWLAVLAHESHNHPSQIVPYEGAATGVGGIVRDVYCMGAEVVGVMDALRMGTGARGGGLKARAILDGVVAGIAGYGNPLGVPNVGGDLEFHERYDGNVLVNVVAAGVVPKDELVHSRVPAKGDFAFVLVGKPTDASGFGGAAFSSGVLGEDTDQRSAVQLPDPFLKRVLAVANRAVLDRAREAGWPIGMKDLGAGGIACVTSELADHGGTGAEIALDQAHRVALPLAPEVFLCSETQERYCFAVPWAVRDEVVAIYNERYRLGDVYPGAGASVIGRTRDDGTYRVTFGGEVVVECPVSFITSGVKRERPAHTPRRAPAGDVAGGPRGSLGGFGEEIRRALGSAALASRAPLYRRYDPEVRGVTAVRAGEADASLLLPVPDAVFGLALGVGGSGRLGLRDPWLGGAFAVLEAARNVAAIGAWPWALTDCLNYGAATDPEVMGALEAGIDGLSTAARALGTLPEWPEGMSPEAWAAQVKGELPPLPFVSGNVSLYNEDDSGAIPPSPIVACAGRLADASRHSTPALKTAGDVLFLVGPVARGAVGGSLFAARQGGADVAPVPAFDAHAERADLALVVGAHARGWVRACHDVSDGGLVQTLAEMSFASSTTPGFDASLPHGGGLEPWFSEEPGFVLAVAPGDREKVECLARALGARLQVMGAVRADPAWRFASPSGTAEIAEPSAYKRAWDEGLEDAFTLRDAVVA